jgi:hypothetical protein
MRRLPIRTHRERVDGVYNCASSCIWINSVPLKMNIELRSLLLFATFFMLAGCRSVDGIYLPDCVAYAGDTIELREGRFEWDKFTDQVIVGDDDTIVDQFPDHPLAGTYLVNEGVVSLIADDGTELPGMHLATVDGRVFLLTDEQFSALRSDDKIASCALVLGGHAKR